MQATFGNEKHRFGKTLFPSLGNSVFHGSILLESLAIESAAAKRY
jgi:hypothetical protein